MEIKVLGTGCRNCKKLLENVKAAVKQLELEARVIYVTDMIAIAESGLMRTPGIIIDGKIISSGKVLSIKELTTLLKQ